MSEKKKSFVKWIVGLIAVLGAGGGADAAGVLPDAEQLEKLGVVGAFGVIVYLHLQVRPLLVEGVSHLRALVGAAELDRQAIRDVAGELDAKKAAESAPVEEMPRVASAGVKRDTKPRLAAVKTEP